MARAGSSHAGRSTGRPAQSRRWGDSDRPMMEHEPESKSTYKKLNETHHPSPRAVLRQRASNKRTEGRAHRENGEDHHHKVFSLAEREQVADDHVNHTSGSHRPGSRASIFKDPFHPIILPSISTPRTSECLFFLRVSTFPTLFSPRGDRSVGHR